VTYPDPWGDQGGWRDPQGGNQRGQYRPDPYRQQRGYQQNQQQPGYQQNDPYQQPGYPPRYSQQDPYQQRGYPPARAARPPEPDRYGGADGNERLTVMTGAVLLILLAAEGFTILRIGRLLTLHFFLGMLLLGPVALKAGSVIYRFYRYYTGSAPYRRKGPPALLLRLLGPFVVLLTACVFGSGVILALVGPPARQPWLTVHKATFILWFGAMAIHVLAYVPRLPRLLYAEARGEALPGKGGQGHAANGRPFTPAVRVLGGRGVRLSLLIASLLAGLVIALATVHLAGVWETPAKVFFHG